MNKYATGLLAAAALALAAVPAASSGTYSDPAGDSGKAGDITSVTVAGDKGSGQLVFTITGTNMGTSDTNVLFLDIDSDANPLTGDLQSAGADYSFLLEGNSYSFGHWDGAHWVDTSYATVRVSGNGSRATISVNRSELGNTSDFNFDASTFDVPDVAFDDAPNDGMFNYSFDANGPQIDSVDVATTPAAGPKAGKRFTVAPTALKLPADGRTATTPILPDSYSCTAKVGAKTLVGSGTGGCTFVVPKKKKARGKTLTVQLTVNYEGAAKVVPLRFKVG
jgi:hypothetical protein